MGWDERAGRPETGAHRGDRGGAGGRGRGDLGDPPARGHVEALSMTVVYQLLVLVVSAAGAVGRPLTGPRVGPGHQLVLRPAHRDALDEDNRGWISLAVFAVTAMVTSRLDRRVGSRGARARPAGARPRSWPRWPRSSLSQSVPGRPARRWSGRRARPGRGGLALVLDPDADAAGRASRVHPAVGARVHGPAGGRAAGPGADGGGAGAAGCGAPRGRAPACPRRSGARGRRRRARPDRGDRPRGRGPASQRRAQDGAAARRLARVPDAADRHPHGRPRAGRGPRGPGGRRAAWRR